MADIRPFQAIRPAEGLEDKIQLKGTFCTGNCMKGVCVTIDAENFSVSPETAELFFRDEILPRLTK